MHFWGQHRHCLNAVSLSQDLEATARLQQLVCRGSAHYPHPCAALRARERTQSWKFLWPETCHKASLLCVGRGLQEPAHNQASEGKKEAHFSIFPLFKSSDPKSCGPEVSKFPANPGCHCSGYLPGQRRCPSSCCHGPEVGRVLALCSDRHLMQVCLPVPRSMENCEAQAEASILPPLALPSCPGDPIPLPNDLLRCPHNMNVYEII